MLDALKNYDWEEVFKAEYATPEWVNGSAHKGTGEAFTRDDVAEIIASEEGENDGASWIMLGRLNDGRYFFIEASCDYTGWGCQEGGRSFCAETRELIEQFGMTLEERTRLRLAKEEG